MAKAHIYLIAYDISSPKRWRRVVRQLERVGERVQLSIFAAHLTPARAHRLEAHLRSLMDLTTDRLFFADLGVRDPAVPILSGTEIKHIRSLIL